MVWRLEDPAGNESAKIKWELVPYTKGRGLDLGCGDAKPFKHFIGVDNGRAKQDYGLRVAANVHYSCENLDMFGTRSMDFVYSSHLLEHIVDTRSSLKEWWRVVKPGGYLVLYLPHKDFYPNIGTVAANPDHKQKKKPTRTKQKHPKRPKPHQ